MQTLEARQVVVDMLKQSLAQKRAKNPTYSARAFARDIGVSPAFVSLLLQGRKKLSPDRAILVSEVFGLNHKRRRNFLRAVFRTSLRRGIGGTHDPRRLDEGVWEDDFFSVDVDRFQFFSHWYHVAVLDLVGCSNFRPDPSWIAKRLGLTPPVVVSTLDRLLRLGLIVKKNQKLLKTNAHIAIPTSASRAPVRNFHRQMIERAKVALEDEGQESFEQREITGITMAIDPTKVKEARRRIQAFKRELSDLLTDGPSTEVYQLNIQFFPLTKRQAGTEK